MFKLEILLVGLLATSLVQCQSQSSASTDASSGHHTPNQGSSFTSSSASAAAPAAPAPAGIVADPVAVPVATPVPAAVPVAGGFPAGLAGLGGLGGLGGYGLPLAGFQKSFDFNAGIPFLGGVGVDAAAAAGAGAPFLGGLVGPSYLPSTWIGSALGAKGDILFPLVIFVFFVFGVWTVINLLMALIVPLVAEKVAKVGLVAGAAGVAKSGNERLLRSVDAQDLSNPSHLTDVNVAELSQKIAECISKGEIHFGTPAVKATQADDKKHI